ncbi:MAG: 50S ribosomal protein L10 [Candidatus Altiarchaeales archaeon IMC4]|nr:MAG: 50S ribosomal protein L10 [Candidatus Altiarchaeales archaeon IMC4]
MVKRELKHTPAKWKVDRVGNLAKKMSDAKVVAIAKIEGIPSKQFQEMRKELKGIGLVVDRNNLVKRAMEKAKIKGMDDYFKGPSALLFTDLNPFKLDKMLRDKRINAPVKAGMKAPFDLVVPEGDTPFGPGPVIGDLQRAGIKAKIQGPKIVVTHDSTVAKEGDILSAEVASVLTRLGIKPIQIGFELTAAYEGGMVYPGNVLYIDEAKTLADIRAAHSNAFNLAMFAGIFNSATIKPLIQKAFNDSRSLAITAEIVNKDTIKELIAMAEAQAKILGYAAGQTGAPAVATEAAPANKEEPKKEDAVSEEDASAGLSSLFG